MSSRNYKSIINYSCFQEALYNLCKIYKKDFRCFFAREWGFVCKEDSAIPLYDRISVPELNGMNRFIQKYMGFNVEFYKTSNELENIICDALLNGKKLLAGMDGYGCNWNTAYQKAHIPHFFLIDEWNEQSRMFSCCDTYYGEHSYKLDIDEFKRYFRNLRVIENIGSIEIIGLQELLQLINSNYKSLGHNPLYYFCLFSDYLARIRDKELLFGKTMEVENCILIQKIQSFAINRKEIGRLLQKYPDVDVTIRENFFDLAEQWEWLKNIFIKIFFQNIIAENQMIYVATLVKNIGAQEEKLYNYIEECINQLE